MNGYGSVMRKAALGLIVVFVAAVLCLAAAAAEQPLSADDVTLLLLGGSPSPKIVALVEQRGVSFKMNPDLAKKFHDAGASDDLIEALTKAGSTAQRTPAAAAAAPPAAEAAPPAANAPTASNAAEVNRKVAEVVNGLGGGAGLGDSGKPQAPAFSLVSLKGERIDSLSYKGDVVVVNFFASWCPHCRRLVPSLVDYQREYHDAGLRVVGVALSDKKPAVESYYQRGGLNYPVAMGDNDIVKRFGGVSGLPTTVLIGRDGRIDWKFSGDPADFDPLEARIKSLLARSAGAPVNSLQAAAAAPASSVGGTSAVGDGNEQGPVLKVASTARSQPAAAAPAVAPKAGGAAALNPAANVGLRIPVPTRSSTSSRNSPPRRNSSARRGTTTPTTRSTRCRSWGQTTKSRASTNRSGTSCLTTPASASST